MWEVRIILDLLVKSFPVSFLHEIAKTLLWCGDEKFIVLTIALGVVICFDPNLFHTIAMTRF